jgi:hypothetical protein
MDEFYRTRMGVTFFGHTLPKIAEELERLNRNLEKLVERLEAPKAQSEKKPEAAPKAGS